ncbi:MAG: DUF6273 domain-containing protein [Eubacteriales bacterium]|nr:DUF6273 domain-containing protein [Eubacteriales bacterium]
MKNDEKIDIKLSMDVDMEGATEDEKNYITAMRYINIAEHMKQFEDQDKYFHRAILYLQKIEGNEYKELITELKWKKYKARAEGKIGLYEEACHIRDKAKTATDYYSAQALFQRIAKYEVKHPIPQKFVAPETFEKAQHCTDSKEQAEYCEQMADAVNAKQRRKSLVASIAMIAVIIAVILFSRTTEARRLLASAYYLVGDYTGSYQKHNAVYERSGKTDEGAYNKYLDARYKAGLKAVEDGDMATAYEDFHAVAKDNYKDSSAQLFAIEQEYLKNTPLSELVQFAGFEWRVLDIQSDKVLLIKDESISGIPFNENGNDCTWSTSSIRTWLNGEFLTENFYKEEQDAIIENTVSNTENPYYKGVDAGEDTKDKVFLLSVEEAEKYVDQLHETKTCWWLRTPGAAEGSMSFVYPNKEVMPYGYDLTTKTFNTKPAIWVSLK